MTPERSEATPTLQLQVICAVCKGSGSIRTIHRYQDVVRFKLWAEIEQCETCTGSGYVPRPTLGLEEPIA